jgi:hypothetical protein
MTSGTANGDGPADESAISRLASTGPYSKKRDGMKTRKNIFAISLALAALGTVAPSCVEHDSAVVLRGVHQLEGSVEDVDFDGDGSEEPIITSCELPSDLTGTDGLFAFSGEIDLSELEERGQGYAVEGGSIYFVDYGGGPGQFNMPMSITSKLASNGSASGDPTSPDGLRVNTNKIQIRRAEIRFPDSENTFQAADGSNVRPSDVGANGIEELSPRFISPLLEEQGSSAIFPVPLILPQELNAFRALHQAVSSNAGQSITLLAEVQVFGETVDGANVESNVFQWPVTICRNCPQLGVTKTCVPVE